MPSSVKVDAPICAVNTTSSQHPPLASHPVVHVGGVELLGVSHSVHGKARSVVPNLMFSFPANRSLAAWIGLL